MPYKILVVDDEPDLETLIGQRFRRKTRAGEFQFVFAQNGLEALARLGEHADVDLVLTDINMPEMDGLTLLTRMGELGRDLKAVVVSAYGDLDNIRTAMNRGAFDFVTKPIDFHDLEITIDKTLTQVDVLKQALLAREELKAMHQEMQVAGELQQSILPKHFPHDPEFALDARMLPARDVGGDFYDFFRIDARRLGLVMADVSGKGVPAAIFMAVSRTLLRFHALQGMAPGDCLARANELLALENPAEMFVTTFYGILDLDTGGLEYANGGHNPPYLIQADGSVLSLPLTGGMALGVMEGLDYRTEQVRLNPGDLLLLYTDGVTEAVGPGQRLYGEAALEALLRGCAGTGPERLVGAVIDAVQHHAADMPQADDLTLLALRYDGAVPGQAIRPVSAAVSG